MKAIVCEMCNGNDFVKQDGLFVCQSCGTKYSVEEAKKLMIEGTVKIDNSSNIENYIANARRAKQSEDWDTTTRYYGLVLENDPANREAIFYCSYAKAKTTLIENDLPKRQAAFKVLINCLSIISDNYDIDKTEENKKIIGEIANDIIAMSLSEYVYNKKIDVYGKVTYSDINETRILFDTLIIEYCRTLGNIAKKYPEDRKSETIYLYELMCKLIDNLVEHCLLGYRKDWKENLNKVHIQWNKIDPKHAIPNIEPELPKPASKSGCYVATAVYGSYDCAEVWTLRRFRDDTLASTWYGRTFIKIYYAISPTLVKWFGETQWFKKMWKPTLNKMVRNLNNKGVENTPYNDKQW